MCGIVGIFVTGRVNPEALQCATDMIGHRGPDGQGVYIDPHSRVGLGHRRLAIIDPHPSGAQPMRSADGRYIITYNGEIYNFPDLKADLVNRGIRFRGTCDTEVLLEGYGVYGEEVLQKLNGIFAFAIFDTVKNEVFLARDHMGVKPLYYAETPAGVGFASEIKALLEVVPVDRSIDIDAIRRYITFLWSPGDATPLKHVRKLNPATAMILRNGKIARIWQYWTPPIYQPDCRSDAQQIAEELRECLAACVKRQLIADVPVGAFLSGGLDSSAIVAAAKPVHSQIDCFTIDAGGAEQGATDDLPYARTVARHLGVPLHEIKVSSAQLCSQVENMVGILDEPLADPACLNVLFISKLAREHGIKVLLSGAGGDDLFTGYRRHQLLAFSRFWQFVPRGLGRWIGNSIGLFGRSSGQPRKIAKLLVAASERGDRQITAPFAWGPERIADRLLAPEARSEMRSDIFEPLDAVLAGRASLSPVEKCLELERRFFLSDHNLVYTDKMSMATGVEVRVPFLDLEMVRFAARVPTELKMKGLRPKWLLKESQRGILPDRIIDRPKTGFGAPLRNWIHGGMGELVSDLLSAKAIASRGLFAPKAVADLVADDKVGRCDGAYTLFSLMCIELWCRRFVDNAQTGGGAKSADVPLLAEPT